MKYVTLIFAFVFATNLSAQQYWKSSRYALVYKITDEQALELTKVSHDRIIANSEIAKAFNPTNLVDTIFFDYESEGLKISTGFQDYDLGTYVAVRAAGEQLEYKFLGFYDIGIVPVFDDKKFYFHIVDTMGNLLKADKVSLAGKTVRYNEKKQRYEYRKFKDDRLLVVENDGKLAFFEVDANHSSHDYWNNGNWFKRQWNRVRYANLWHSPWYALQKIWQRQVYDFKYIWDVKTYGYITTNKPKYLPNDTVKIKAFLTRDNNIAYNSPLTLKITQYGNYKFETTIKPTSRGSYEFEFPLGDSLQLDKTYYISLQKNNRQLMQTTFVYEDYQLDEVAYDLRADQKKFKRYEPIVFYAEGKNKNGQYVMDGEVEITATISNIKAYHAQKVFIPDTLFHYKGALDLGEAMRFPLEKETIPMADFTVNVNAAFTNSNGELQNKTLNFDIISDTTIIEMSLDGDVLSVDYLVNGKSTPILATLELDMNETDFYVEKTVQLPYQETINPVFNDISVTANGETKNISLEINRYYRTNPLLKEPTFNLVQTMDSVFVFGNNPNGLAVTYEIYRLNRKIASGESSDKAIIWKDKINRKTSYRIDYEYIINGKGRQGSQKFDRAKNLLTVEIDQPTQIQPGETVDIKVKVRKNNKSNARNVSLVAGAVNTQFDNTQVWKYNVPFYGRTSDTKKVPNYYNENLKYAVGSYTDFNWVQPINERFREDLQIEEELYYQLLFPKNGYYETERKIVRDSSYNIAEAVPFVVKDGKFEPIYLIYINRKLVYYYDTKTPYSFKGQKGYNSLVIRGKDFELQIDSVYLDNGVQTIFSIDLNNLPKNTRLIKRPNYWTEAEKALLRRSIFTYQKTGRNNQIYVWQNDVVYPHNSGANFANFGPFEPNQNLHFIRKNEFKTTFLFEPGFQYQIEKNRERLYNIDVFPANKNVEILPIKARTDLGQRLFLNKNIEIFDKPYVEPLRLREVKAAFTHVKYVSNSGKTQYQIAGQDSSIYRSVLVQEGTSQAFYFSNNYYYKNLPIGNYKIYAFTPWGNYFEHNVTIRRDTMLYEYLENQVYQNDDNLKLLKSLVALKDIVVPELPKVGQNNTTTPSTKPKETIIYNGATYSVSGKVTDERGEGVISATIMIKGTTIGTTSDLDGNYTIEIPVNIENPVLVISYIGFNTTELSVDVNSDADYDLTISENADVLDEVVVVGYGTSTRQEVTSSISVVTAESIQSMPARDVSQLMGEVAGVQAGSRKDETTYYIDGIAVSDTSVYNNLQANSKIRSNFADYAFWQPNLRTDRKGEATFRVTYPDDITSYQTFVVGMDRRQNFGLAAKTVNSQKMALAQLAIPRFMIVGDKANIIGKSLNYSNDSLKIKSTFLLDNDVLKTNNFWLENAKIETAELLANTDKDTLMLTYKMEHSKFFDGEKRPIPIYRKGVEETVGSFNILHGDTSLTLNFESDKGNVKLYAKTDVLEVLLEDVQYLIDYPYGCNEQTASRLLALLMDKQIKTALGQKPPKDEAIMKMVKRLEKSQNDDGSWGWWSGNATNYWMTNYVLKALYAADTSGYKTPSYETGLRFVTNTLNEIPPYELLNSIELLSDVGQNMNYKPYLEKVDTNVRYNDYYNQLRMTKIKQQQGLDYDLLVLDILENQTLFGGIFYDINQKKQPYYRWYWYSNRYNLTQMAYQILKNENAKQNGEYDYKLAAIRGFFLEKRSRHGWRNTFTTAQILSTIVPDMMNGQPIEKPKLVMKGTSTQTATEFPFETMFYSNNPIKIEKTGTSTIYLTAYQEFWNDKPTPKSDVFELKSKLVQNGKTVKKLEAKIPAKIVVTVEVKKEAEYVMIEIPIPAGCSYGEKSRGYGYWYGREVHREYFREKTCVFYQNLPVGTYTIELNLEPRFTGEYTVNPAKAEEMYFPVFYGRNAIKEVEIE